MADTGHGIGMGCMQIVDEWFFFSGQEWLG
jgi:hypothetical protein